MAIVVTYRPQILSPTYNPVGISCTSTNQTLDKYQMLFDLYSAGTTSRFHREKAVVGPDGYCKSNLQSILKNYLSYDLSPTATGVTFSTPSRFKFDLQIGEEYVVQWPFYDNYFGAGSYVGFTGTTAHPFSVGDRVFIAQTAGYAHQQYEGVHEVRSASTFSIIIDYTPFSASPTNPGVITFADSRVSKFTGITALSSITVNNAAFSHLDWINYNVNNYNLTAATSSFFTDSPQQFEQGDESRSWINFYHSSGTTMKTLFVQTLDSGGNQIGVYTLGLGGVGSLSENYYKVGVGPWNITNTAFIPSGSSTLPIMKSTVDVYKVWIDSNTESERKEFKLDHRCSRFDSNISLCFLDRKGSFISKEFQLGRTQGDEIEKQEFKAPIGEFNGSTYSYNSYDRGRTIYNADVTTKYTAVSNWTTEEDSNYLRQLFSSPEVYWNNGGTFIPIIIKNNFYKIPNSRIDKIFNVTVEFELAFRDPINV
jgi:hypothetical protein